MAAVLVLACAALLIAWWRSDNDCAERARRTPAHPMNAVVYCEYGAPEVLRVERIEKPVPSDDQVLVRVHAASVNPLISRPVSCMNFRRKCPASSPMSLSRSRRVGRRVITTLIR